MSRFILSVTAATVLALAVPRVLPAYDHGFILNFTNAGDTAGWSDPVNIPATTFVTGETTPADSPAYSPAPNAAAGFNSTGWMRIGRASGDNYGVALAIYDGTDGGSTITEPTDYVLEADVFVVLDATLRNQQGIAGRWTALSGNIPFEVFYAHNTPNQPSGYGWRGSGAIATYGQFTTESTNRWVRMRMKLHGYQVDVAVDNNLDGTYDFTQANITLTATGGKAGVFSIINNPNNGSLGVANRFSYFDNFQCSTETGVFFMLH